MVLLGWGSGLTAYLTLLPRALQPKHNVQWYTPAAASLSGSRNSGVGRLSCYYRTDQDSNGNRIICRQDSSCCVELDDEMWAGTGLRKEQNYFSGWTKKGAVN